MQLAICKCSQPPPGRSARGSWPGLAGIGRDWPGRAGTGWDGLGRARPVCGGNPPPSSAASNHKSVTKRPSNSRPPRRFHRRSRHPFRRPFRSCFDSTQACQTVRWGRFQGLLFALEKRAKAPCHGLPPACKDGQRRKKRCVKAARRGLRMQPTAARQIGSWFVACGWNGPEWASLRRQPAAPISPPISPPIPPPIPLPT